MEGDNNYSISMTIFSYDPNIKFLCCKNHRSNHWRCSVKEGVLKNFAYNFIKKRLQHRCFPVKLAKFLRTSIFKNTFERLLLQDIIEKTIHLFPSQNQDLVIITITFEAFKFLLSFCAVIIFANLYCKSIISFLLC